MRKGAPCISITGTVTVVPTTCTDTGAAIGATIGSGPCSCRPQSPASFSPKQAEPCHEHMRDLNHLDLPGASELPLMLGGCITVKAPDKPIVIELNVNIKQEVIYRLSGDAAQTIDKNAEIF